MRRDLCSVSLDGRPLWAVDRRIRLVDVRECPPQLRVRTTQKAGREGLHVTQIRREALEVTVLFEVRESDPARRQEVLSKVAAWCAGRVLRVSTRPGMRLRAVCTTLPAGGSALRWTEVLTAVFTAYETPWWEAETPVRAAGEGRETELWLDVPGSGTSVMELTAENKGEAVCGQVTVRCGSDSLTLAGLTLAPGEKLRIGHDEAGYMTLCAQGSGGTRSVYACRTPGSADEVRIQPGRSCIRCEADTPLSWQAEVRGRWQ